jgi:hypothetical protein
MQRSKWALKRKWRRVEVGQMTVPRWAWAMGVLGPKKRFLEIQTRPMEIEELRLRQLTERVRVRE